MIGLVVGIFLGWLIQKLDVSSGDHHVFGIETATILAFARSLSTLFLNLIKSIIASLIFAIFLFTYVKLDSAFMQAIVDNEPMGRYLNAYIISFLVGLEGVFSGLLVTFILINYLNTDEVSESMGQNARLAASGAGEDEQRSVAVLDGGTLFRVQFCKEFFQTVDLLSQVRIPFIFKGTIIRAQVLRFPLRVFRQMRLATPMVPIVPRLLVTRVSHRQ